MSMILLLKIREYSKLLSIQFHWVDLIPRTGHLPGTEPLQDLNRRNGVKVLILQEMSAVYLQMPAKRRTRARVRTKETRDAY